MRKTIIVIVLILATAVFSGCGSKDAKRAKALHDMPVLWESEFVIANPDMPDMRNFVAMYDSYDASMAAAWTKDKFTEDYIPESVMVFKFKSYRNKPLEITIEMGDTLSVLAYPLAESPMDSIARSIIAAPSPSRRQ